MSNVQQERLWEGVSGSSAWKPTGPVFKVCDFWPAHPNSPPASAHLPHPPPPPISQQPSKGLGLPGHCSCGPLCPYLQSSLCLPDLIFTISLGLPSRKPCWPLPSLLTQAGLAVPPLCHMPWSTCLGKHLSPLTCPRTGTLPPTCGRPQLELTNEWQSPLGFRSNTLCTERMPLPSLTPGVQDPFLFC